MSSGERPIGAAKGKQSDTEALCPPPPLPPPRPSATAQGGVHSAETERAVVADVPRLRVDVTPSGQT